MADASFSERFSALPDPALDEAKRRLGQGMAPVQPQTPATRPALAPVENPQPPQLSTGMGLPPPPHLRDAPAPQPADERNPLEVFDVFKNPAIVLAGLGSLFTRSAMTTAFNSAAGAINGYRSGQQQVFEQNKERWHQAAQEALDQNQMEITKYKIALEQRDMKARMASMYAIASQTDNPIIKTMMQKGDVGGAYDLIHKMADIQIKAKEAFAVETSKIEAREGASGAGEEAHIRAIGEYREAPPVGNRQFTPEGRRVLDKLHEAYPDYDYKQWLAKSGEAKVVGSAEAKAESGTLATQVKQKAAIEAFEANTVQQGRRLLDLALKKDAGGIPVVQSWVNAGMRATGDPLIAKFDAQMAVYRPEVAKILFNPNLSGVLTVHAQEEAQNLLRGDITYKSLKAVVDLLEKDFKTRSDSLDEEISKTKSRLHGASGEKKSSASGTTSSGVTWSASP